MPILTVEIRVQVAVDSELKKAIGAGIASYWENESGVFAEDGNELRESDDRYDVSLYADIAEKYAAMKLGIDPRNTPGGV